MNVVCVGAHQDDEMACLGTLIIYRRQGHQVAFICMTNGDKGLSWNPEATPSEAARIRDAEMRDVAAELDASYRCLDREDEFLTDDKATRLALINLLRDLRAEVVFTHWRDDYNLDHVVTSSVVFQATLLTQIASVRTEHAPLSRPPAIFYMDPGDGHDFEATHFVELPEDVMQEKLRLMRLHTSQMNVMREMRGEDYADIMLGKAGGTADAYSCHMRRPSGPVLQSEEFLWRAFCHERPSARE